MRCKYGLLLILLLPFVAASQSITPTGPTSICAGGGVTLTVTGAPGGSTFQWLRDGVPLSVTSISYTATLSGSYSVDVTSSGNTVPYTPVTITINSKPVPAYTFNNNNACAGTPVQFTSSVTGGTTPYSYSWNFGSSNTSTLQNPTHSFVALGCGGSTSFSPVLTVNDANGCSNTVTNSITVLNAPDVQLQDVNTFSAFRNCDNSPTPANPNYTLTVNNISPSASCINTYALDWGDGSAVVTGLTSSSFPLTHTYTQLGAFNLVITGQSSSCSYSKTYIVANQSNPAGNLGTLGSTTNLCVPAIVPFTISDTWKLNSPGTKYVIDFDDGNSVTLNHPLNATLTTEIINHTYTISSCPSPTYTARLRVINACDESPYTAGNIQIRIGPTAAFTSASNGCVGQAVNFNNTTAFGYYGGSCQTTTAYSWNFGDAASGASNTSTLTNPNHVFSTPGTYTVTVTATNPCGTTTATGQVCIVEQPVPSFTIDNTTGCSPLTVTATNTSNTLSSCAAATYSWSVSYASGFCGTTQGWTFASGSNTSSVNPSFIFNNPGTYTIRLSVTNACGTFSTTKTVTIKKPPNVSLPVISNNCGIVTLTPNPTVLNCGIDPLSYSWAFTGGSISTSSVASPGSISFSTVGTNTVSLSVTNECGTSFATRSFTISAPPDVIVPSSLMLCAGTATGVLSFTGSLGGTTFNWVNNTPSIGLAGSGTGNISSFTTANAGTSPLTATITVTPVLGCSGTPLSFTVTANPKPSTPLVSSPVNYCQNAIASQLSVTASAGNALTWYSDAGLTSVIAGTPTPSTSAGGNTSYYVTQENIYGCRSNVSTINVAVTTAISNNTITGNQTICSGSSPVLTVSAVSGGSGSFSYQWESSHDGVLWANAPGSANNSSYNPAAITATTYYRRKVSSGACSQDVSNEVTVTVLGSLINTAISADQSLCEGSPTALLSGQLPVGGDGTYIYEWQSSTNNINWTALASSNIKDYQPPVLTTTTYYRRKVTSGLCNVTSASVSITIHNNPVAAAVSPLSVNVCQGADVTLTASNYIGVIKKWQYNLTPANTATWVDVTSISSSTTFTNVQNSFSARVIVEQTGACGNEAASTNVPVNVAGTTVAGTTGPDATICAGINAGTITLTGNTGNVLRWEQSVNNGNNWSAIANTTSSLNYLNLNVSTWYRAVIQSGACPSSNSSITRITVIQNVTVSNAGTDQAVCAQTAVTLNGNSPVIGTGVWNQVSGPPVTIVNPALRNTQVTGLLTGQIYLFRWSINSTGCPSSSDDVQVINAPSLTPAVAGSDKLICVFTGSVDSVVMNANVLLNPAFETGTWTFGASNPIGSAPIIRNINNPVTQFVFDKAGTYHLTWTVSNGICNAMNDAVIVNVFDKPAAGILTASATTACVGNNISVTAGITKGDIVKWQYNFSTMNATDWTDTAVTSTSIVFPNAQRSFNARLITRSEGIGVGCTQSDTSRLPIEIIPDYTNIVDTTEAVACPGLSVMITGQPSTGAYNVFQYQWQESQDGKTNWTDIPGQTLVSLEMVPTTSMYVRRMVTVSPCSKPSLPVYVYVRPAAANFLMSDSVGTCFPFEITFTNLVLPASTTTWNFGDGAFNQGDIIKHTYRSIGTFDVVMTAQYPGGCRFEATKKVIITGPTGFLKYDHDIICLNQPVYFEVSSPVSDSVRWNFGDGISQVTIDRIVYHTYSQPGPFKPYAELLAGPQGRCLTRINGPDTLFVDNIVAGFRQSVLQKCGVTNISFIDTARAFYGIKSWEWDFGDGNASTDKNPLHAYTRKNQWNVRQVVTGNRGCRDTANISMPVAVWSIPDIKTNKDSVACVGEIIPYEASVFSEDAIIGVTWNFSSGSNANTLKVPKAYSFPGNYLALFTATTVNGCSDTARLPLAVYPQLSIQLDRDTLLSTGTIFPLQSVVTNGPVTSWQWTPSSTLDCSNCPLPKAAIKNNVTYVVNATNAGGCKATDSITIRVFCEGSQVFVPNVFTPDGDGLNDILMVRGKGIKSVKNFRVFNRAGMIVFERSNFSPNDPNYGWDGKVNGKQTAPEVYVYTYEVVCENDIVYTSKGNITVIRER